MDRKSGNTARADVTVWIPLLHILGGIAERVVSHPQDELANKKKAGGDSPAETGGAA